jgi:radical SAM protein with 4Fe4S-binding SPASM domain
MKERVRWQYFARSGRLLADILRGRYDFTYDLMPFHERGMSWAKRTNLLRAGLNLLYRRSRPWSWPIHMMVELTSYCNLRCPVCPTGAGRLTRSPAAIELDLLKRILDEAGPYLLTLSLWGWGEPLLHPRLRDALRIVRESGAASRVSTNGQNLHRPDVQEALLAYPPALLIVAIDGLTEGTNARYRVDASLEQALEGVRALAQKRQAASQPGPHLQMRFLATRANEHEVPLLEDFARRNMFDSLSVRTLSTIEGPEPAHEELVPEDGRLRAYAHEGGPGVLPQDFTCQIAFAQPTVLVDGTVVACDQDFNADAAFGRMGDGVLFRDLWFGRPAREVRRQVRDAPQTLAFCRNCPYTDRIENTCSIAHVDLRESKAARPEPERRQRA